MAEYYWPGLDQMRDDFSAKMQAHLDNLDDLGAALDGATDPVAVMDDWEARQLLRKMPDESVEN